MNFDICYLIYLVLAAPEAASLGLLAPYFERDFLLFAHRQYPKYSPDNMIPYAGQILNPAASDQNYGMFL